METNKVTKYSHRLAQLNAVIRFHESMMQSVRGTIELGGGIQKVPPEVKTILDDAAMVLDQMNVELDSVFLLHQAALLAGDYKEFSIGEPIHPRPWEQ